MKQHLATAKIPRAGVLWFTGLSGAGKSTLALAVAQALAQRNSPSYVLDGDSVRQGLCRDLGFSEADRSENIRRIGEVAKLFADAGLVAITACISPFRADRQLARSLLEPGRFIEVHVDTPLAVCEARDPKGLYRRARSGQLPHFTGVGAPYEAPQTPELRISTAALSVPECAETVLALLDARGYIYPQGPKSPQV